MKTNLLPRCQCCGKVPEKGLYDGIRVNGILFCRTCTQEVVSSTPKDSYYEHFLGSLKNALFSRHRLKKSKGYDNAWSTINEFKPGSNE